MYQKGIGLFYDLLHAGYLVDRRQIMLKAQQMEHSQLKKVVFIKMFIIRLFLSILVI